MQYYLHSHFPDSDFSLWIIEQDDEELFNRGWLVNVGLKEIMTKHPETQCIILNDVDLVPDLPFGSRGLVPYNQCDLPIQLGSELEHFNWGVPYDACAGGIVSMNANDWRKINGLSNDYIGWGGEDDDLYERLRINKLLVPNNSGGMALKRPPKGNGVFRVISQDQEHHEKHHKDPVQYQLTLTRREQMRKGSTRWKTDGLSDLYYYVTDYKKAVGSRSTPSNFGFSSVHHVKAKATDRRGNQGDNTTEEDKHTAVIVGNNTSNPPTVDNAK